MNFELHTFQQTHMEGENKQKPLFRDWEAGPDNREAKIHFVENFKNVLVYYEITTLEIVTDGFEIISSVSLFVAKVFNFVTYLSSSGALSWGR